MTHFLKGCSHTTYARTYHRQNYTKAVHALLRASLRLNSIAIRNREAIIQESCQGQGEEGQQQEEADGLHPEGAAPTQHSLFFRTIIFLALVTEGRVRLSRRSSMFQRKGSKHLSIPYLRKTSSSTAVISASMRMREITIHRACSKLMDNVIKNILASARRADDETLLNLRNSSESSKKRKAIVSMKTLGHEQPWTDIMKRVSNADGPVLLYGPTGCGKTHLVRTCSYVMDLKLFEVGPAEVDSSSELTSWLSHVCNAKTLLGPRMVLVDDIEGLEPQVLRTLHANLKKHTKSPIIMTCTDPYIKELRSFRDVERIRMRAPTVHSCIAWANGQSLKADGGGLRTAAEKSRGDLRQLSMRLSGNRCLAGMLDRKCNMFDAMRSLMRKETSLEEWTSSDLADSGPEFLHYNVYSISKTVEKACQVLENLSSLDAPWHSFGYLPELKAVIGGTLRNGDFAHTSQLSIAAAPRSFQKGDVNRFELLCKEDAGGV